VALGDVDVDSTICLLVLPLPPVAQSLLQSCLLTTSLAVLHGHSLEMTGATTLLLFLIFYWQAPSLFNCSMIICSVVLYIMKPTFDTNCNVIGRFYS
jgi:hypothetical protein